MQKSTNKQNNNYYNNMSSIFDRLSNPTNFTGSAKNVRSKSSLDSPVRDLSQITRPAFKRSTSMRIGKGIPEAETPEKKVKTLKRGDSGIFDRLSTPTNFTGIQGRKN